MKKVNLFLLSTLCMFIFFSINAQEDYVPTEYEQPIETCTIPIDLEDELECDLEDINDGEIAVVEPEVEALECPSEKNLVHKESVIIRKPNVTEVKKVLDAYVKKHQNSQAMKDAMKKLFSCAECILPDVDPCVEEVEITSITYSTPKKIRPGVYRSTITVKFKAKCEGCELGAPRLVSTKTSPTIGSPFPNPVEHNLHLDIEVPANVSSFQISVIDIMGKEVMAQRYNSISKNKSHIDLDVAQLDAGNYILRLHLNKEDIRSYRFTKI